MPVVLCVCTRDEGSPYAAQRGDVVDAGDWPERGWLPAVDRLLLLLPQLTLAQVQPWLTEEPLQDPQHRHARRLRSLALDLQAVDEVTMAMQARDWSLKDLCAATIQKPPVQDPLIFGEPASVFG